MTGLRPSRSTAPQDPGHRDNVLRTRRRVPVGNTCRSLPRDRRPGNTPGEDTGHPGRAGSPGDRAPARGCIHSTRRVQPSVPGRLAAATPGACRAPRREAGRGRNHRRERGTPGIPHRRIKEATPCPAQESRSTPTARSESRGASRFAIRRVTRSRPRPAEGPTRSAAAGSPPGNPSATGRTRPATSTGPWRQGKDRPEGRPRRAPADLSGPGPAARVPPGAILLRPAVLQPSFLPTRRACMGRHLRRGSDGVFREPTRVRSPAAWGLAGPREGGRGGDVRPARRTHAARRPRSPPRRRPHHTRPCRGLMRGGGAHYGGAHTPGTAVPGGTGCRQSRISSVGSPHWKR